VPERRVAGRKPTRKPIGVYLFPKGKKGRLRDADNEDTAVTAVNDEPVRFQSKRGRDGEDVTVTAPGASPAAVAAGSDEESTELSTDPRKPRPKLKKGKEELRAPRARTPPSVPRRRLEIQELLAAPDPVAVMEGLGPGELRELALVGHKLFDLGKLNAARVIFEGLVGLGSQEAFPHTMLGTVYLALGDRGRAFLLFEAALRFDREDLAARVYRAEVLLTAGRKKEATKDLRSAIDQGPADDPFVDRAHRLLKMAEERERRRSTP
jgi:hypothetical protein